MKNLIIFFVKTPGTLYCENRKLTEKKPPSNIPAVFSYSEEIFKDSAISYIRNLFYDETLKLVRYETRERFQSIFNTNETEPDRFGDDPIIYINDYSIGVSYRINRNTDTCRIDSISTSSIDFDQQYTQSLLNSADGNYIIRLRSAKSLLQLDSDYLFTGKRTINGIDSNVFISKAFVGKIPFVNEYAFPVVSIILIL